MGTRKMFNSEDELDENRLLDKLLVMLNQDSADDDDSEDEDDSDNSSEWSETNEGVEATSYHHNVQQLCKPIKIDPVDFNEVGSTTDLLQLLSVEEFDIVTDCKDVELKELMVLNRIKNEQIKSLIKSYTNLLSQCQSYCHYQPRKNKIQISTSYATLNKCGFPYFHCNESRPCNNADYFKQKASNVVNFSYAYKNLQPFKISRKLKICVMFNYYTNYLIKENSPKHKKLFQLTKPTAEDAKGIATRVKNLKKQLDTLKAPDCWDDTYLNWEYIAEKYFSDVMLAQTLRTLWNMYTHPSINTSNFTKAEANQISEYVREHNPPDWVECAKMLKKNRSEYLVCAQYQMSMMDECDDESDNSDPGTKKEYYQRTTKNCTVGEFSALENFRILSLVKKYGTDFKKISEYIPNRTVIQIKHRYESNLTLEHMRFGSFTRDEDEAILEHVKQHGEGRWRLLTKKLSRNAAQLRLRCKRVMKWMAENPGVDTPTRSISTSYSKKHRQLVTYASRISRADVELPNWPVRKYRTDIDDKLVHFFSPTAQLKNTRRVSSVQYTQLASCAQAVKTVLGIFGTTLYFPKDLTRYSFYHDMDDIDAELLLTLRGRTQGNSSSDKGDYATVVFSECEGMLMPPNVSSMQALRYLLLQSFDTEAAAIATDQPLADTQHVRRFKERFKQFFALPSLMSIVEPPETVQAVNTDKADAKKRPVGRPPKDLSKIHKMNAARAANKAQQLHNQLEAVKTECEEQSENPIAEPCTNASESPCSVSFTFQGGKLIPSEPAPAQARSPAPNPSVNDQQNGCRILKKLDKTTIQMLKEKNLLKSVKPIKIIQQTNVLRKQDADVTSINATSATTPGRKRSNPNTNKSKTKKRRLKSDLSS